MLSCFSPGLGPRPLGPPATCCSATLMADDGSGHAPAGNDPSIQVEYLSTLWSLHQNFVKDPCRQQTAGHFFPNGFDCLVKGYFILGLSTQQHSLCCLKNWSAVVCVGNSKESVNRFYHLFAN
jgi:hypothetical protein